MRKLYTKEHQSWDTVCESILSNLMYERIGRDVIATLINEMRIYSETKVDVATQEVLSILHVDGQGWNVVFEGTPVYQDSVEHMSDEQLRASIEDLRARRLSQPVTKSRVTRVSKSTSTPESAEDKQLSSVLNGMSLEAKAELMKKLGLVD